MKKIVISTIITTTLATNMMAEIKPYIGLGFNSFGIYNSDITARDKTTGASFISTEDETRDSGSTIGLNGGAIISDNSKINFSYFSGKEKDSEIIKITVMAVSYNYSFNNQGVRKGWYIGAGFSNIKTEIEYNTLTTSSSASGTGLLLRGGYEYQMNDNLLFDIGFNSHSAEQKLNYDYKIYDNIEGSSTTRVSNLNISLNYIF